MPLLGGQAIHEWRRPLVVPAFIEYPSYNLRVLRPATAKVE